MYHPCLNDHWAVSALNLFSAVMLFKLLIICHASIISRDSTKIYNSLFHFIHYIKQVSHFNNPDIVFKQVVLPTFILERRSLLEMFADCMAHPDIFVR